MLRAIVRLCAGVAVAMIWLTATAQDYPSRPVKLLVPFAAGGPADVYARFLAQRLQEAMGQPFVVENRPGGGAVLGTEIAAKSAPDGYTLLVMSNTHTVNESLLPNRPYQLFRDFAPVAPIMWTKDWGRNSLPDTSKVFSGAMPKDFSRCRCWVLPTPRSAATCLISICPE